MPFEIQVNQKSFTKKITLEGELTSTENDQVAHRVSKRVQNVDLF